LLQALARAFRGYQMDSPVVSVLNMKGGVGKTIITLNLAHALASQHSKRVLLVDFDPQANATSGLLDYKDYEEHRKKKRVISDIFTDLEKLVGPVSDKNPKIIKLKDMLIRVRSYEGSGFIDLVPSELELSTILERSGGSSLEDRLKLILRDKKKKYDFVLIDCGPTYSVLTNNALKASDYVLIPVRPDPFSARGIPMLLSKIQAHNLAHTQDDTVTVLGILFTMVNENLQYVSSVKSEILREHSDVFRSEILRNEHYSRALFEHKSIFETPAQKKFKTNFTDFVDEFMERINQPRK
jgi:chromosome partitioning protein